MLDSVCKLIKCNTPDAALVLPALMNKLNKVEVLSNMYKIHKTQDIINYFKTRATTSRWEVAMLSSDIIMVELDCVFENGNCSDTEKCNCCQHDTFLVVEPDEEDFYRCPLCLPTLGYKNKNTSCPNGINHHSGEMEWIF
jgi:hypothetical protein